MLYNQTTEYATTSSPYFTQEKIDNACYNCANEVGSPAVFSSQCDICKTLTVTTVKTYNWFDTLVLMLIPILAVVVIGFFIPKRKYKI